jgi:para-nitrobenzyl esterase
MRFRLTFTLLCCTAVFAAVDGPVQVENGRLTGAPGSSLDVRVFKGIPYAAPPVGDLRWKAP